MKEYSSPMMDIAYYAERSIQDEIERESKSDVSTILISYFVMFAYVAISLGNFNTEPNRILVSINIVYIINVNYKIKLTRTTNKPQGNRKTAVKLWIVMNLYRIIFGHTRTAPILIIFLAITLWSSRMW